MLKWEGRVHIFFCQVKKNYFLIFLYLLFLTPAIDVGMIRKKMPIYCLQVRAIYIVVMKLKSCAI